MSFEPYLLPPLPMTLEESHREIRYLQHQVYLARQGLAKQIEEREKDRRACKGNIKAIADENRELRERLIEVHRELRTLKNE